MTCIEASPRMWASAVRAAGDRLRHLARECHPSWLWPFDADAPPAGDPDSWARLMGVGAIGAPDLASARARVCVLPPRAARRAFVLRALIGRAAEARRCVDAAARREIIACVGVASWGAVCGCDVPRGLRGHAIDAGEGGLPGLQALAWEGFGLLRFGAEAQRQRPLPLPRLARTRFAIDLAADAPGRGEAPPACEWADAWVLDRLFDEPLEVPPWCSCDGMSWASNWT